MAHKKGVGSSKNGRESAAQRLGIKIFGGQKVIAGNIISTMLVTMLLWVRTILFMHLLTELFSSTRASATRAMFR